MVSRLCTGLIQIEETRLPALERCAEYDIVIRIRRDNFPCNRIHNGLVGAGDAGLIDGQLSEQTHSPSAHVSDLESGVPPQFVFRAGIELLKVRRPVVAIHDARTQWN